MAIWQFSVVFIPTSWAKRNNYNISLFYNEEGYNTRCAWKENQPNLPFIDILSKILPISESWHNNLLTWGKSTEHDIQVWYENRVISSICIRLDLRQKINEIIVKITDAAKTLDCVLFFPELKKMVEPNDLELRNALRDSNAAKFFSH